MSFLFVWFELFTIIKDIICYLSDYFFVGYFNLLWLAFGVILYVIFIRLGLLVSIILSLMVLISFQSVLRGRKGVKFYLADWLF